MKVCLTMYFTSENYSGVVALNKSKNTSVLQLPSLFLFICFPVSAVVATVKKRKKMTDAVIYSEIKFKLNGEDSGKGIEILPTNHSGTQTQLVRLHGESSQCHFQSQGGQQRFDMCPNRCQTVIPPTVSKHLLPACPVNWLEYKDMCYFIGRTKLTILSALISCRQNSSELVHTEDFNTLIFLRPHMGDASYWIGLIKLEHWFWMDGRQLQNAVKSFFSNTDHLERSCTTVSKNAIFAEKCDALMGYICQKEAKTYA
ncbi:killer cell lectin-like receptor subfamily B member 1A isoform X2 [Conger conger]|uniref:killer cell lectin-like receptor subfamily B member 1A isoform X2 n=1 Tax=Conger conger TaxID=82655 RepID=UPI002A5AFFDB|nr:killer cell lectin-like receptor subfamily B member 1A isoform X2 [Conger conger]